MINFSGSTTTLTTADCLPAKTLAEKITQGILNKTEHPLALGLIHDFLNRDDITVDVSITWADSCLDIYVGDISIGLHSTIDLRPLSETHATFLDIFSLVVSNKLRKIERNEVNVSGITNIIKKEIEIEKEHIENMKATHPDSLVVPRITISKLTVN